jgi:ATP-dependent RNA helicase DOB1
MLLNMMRVEGANPTFLVKSSFHQYQQERGAPALDIEADELAQARDEINVKDEDIVKEYYTIHKQLSLVDQDITAVKMLPENVVAFLQSGRLVHVALTNEKDEFLDFGWGAVVDFRTSKKNNSGVPVDATLEVIISCVADEKNPTPPSSTATTVTDGSGGGVPARACEMRVVKINFKALKDLSTIRIFLPKDLKTEESRQTVSKTLGEVVRRLGVIPSLDPVVDMKVMGISGMLERKQSLQTRLEAIPFHNAVDRQLRLAEYSKKHELSEKVKLLRKTSKQAQV